MKKAIVNKVNDVKFYMNKVIAQLTMTSVSLDQLVVFDVITMFEGNIGLKNPPKIKTYIKANQKCIQLLIPIFLMLMRIKYMYVLN